MLDILSLIFSLWPKVQDWFADKLCITNEQGEIMKYNIEMIVACGVHKALVLNMDRRENRLVKLISGTANNKDNVYNAAVQKVLELNSLPVEPPFECVYVSNESIAQ